MPYLKERVDYQLTRYPRLYLAVDRYSPGINWDKRVYLSFIRRGDNVLDVGANVGAHTVFFSHLVRANGRVLAFEPVPENLVALEEGVLLLAIGERGSSTTWRPSRVADAATIRLAERWITERLPLRDPAACAALARVARREAPAAAAAVPLIAEVLHRAGKLLESLRRPDVRIGGAENIASQPEFQSADRLRGLVALLAEPGPLTRAMDAFMGAGGARVTIGRELGEGAMRACSLVGTGIASGRFHGSLGVLGPVRMPYPRLLSLVSYVGGRLAEFA